MRLVLCPMLVISLSECSGGLEVHRDAIDAIAQIGGRRTVGEYMAQVTAATAAMHFGAEHAVAAIIRVLDGAGFGIVEARPAGAAREFLIGDEQRLVATGANKGARTLLEVKLAASRRFGAVPA